MRFNAGASEGLVEALREGPASFLPALVRSQPIPRLLDLRLRRRPRTRNSRATLYLGMRAVLEVVHRASTGDVVLEAVTGGPLEQYVRREGAVQARLCARTDGPVAVVDREAQFAFDSAEERDSTMAEVTGPYRAFLARIAEDRSERWHATGSGAALGGEVDAVAVDERGRLLTIEVKPAVETSRGRWAPVQASVYAALFQRWVRLSGPEHAQRAVHDVLAQRVALGLSPDLPLADELEIVPVVAFGSERWSPQLLPQLARVQEELLASGIGWPNLEVWRVDDQGAIERVPLTD